MISQIWIGGICSLARRCDKSNVKASNCSKYQNLRIWNLAAKIFSVGILILINRSILTLAIFIVSLVFVILELDLYFHHFHRYCYFILGTLTFNN